MQRAVKTVISAALAAAVVPGNAVVLNPHGTGQVLIYPYYTVNAGSGTLLSIVNTTAGGKALKVRIHEGYNGRDVLVFNLYLSPFDVWVAQIFDTSTDGSGGAAIATNDNTCTVPAFPKMFGPAPGNGAGAAAFGDAGYTGANADHGPTGITRTREGYLEIIEMGTVTNDHQSTLNAITHGSSGVPSSCSQLVRAWTAEGYWSSDATTDIGPPDGGLFGAESIINVGEGLMYTVNAESIDGFSSVAQHTLPGSASPDLGSASKSADGTVSAFVPVSSGMVEAKFQNPADAISALFMVDNLYNEYVVDPGIGAQSDWMITFPTKRFYTDPALLAVGATHATAPFDALFSSANGGTSCVQVGTQFWSREEQTVISGDFFSCGGCVPAPVPALCYATSPLTIGSSTSALVSHLLMSTPFTTQIDLAAVGFKSGWLRVDLANDSTGSPQLNHAIPSLNGLKFLGLPALGFAAIDYVNGNVMPGLLANYSGAYPHRAHVTCVNSATGDLCQ